MMKYALLHGERICEFSADADGCFPVSPELRWIEVADDTTDQDSYVNGAVVKYVAPVPAVAPPSFLARDFLALLTPDDYAAIQTAISGSAALGLLWAGLLGQGDAPIHTDAARFQQGWAGLTQALGQARADEIATALGF